MTQPRLRQLCLSMCALFSAGCPSDDADDQGTGSTDTTNGSTSGTSTTTSSDTTSTSSSTDSTTSADTTTTGTTVADTGGTDGMAQVPPTGERALVPWLEDGNYLDWDTESAVHASAGPHNDVRTYVNGALYDSLSAGATEHPVGAAAVKELYSGQDLDGWAVTVKVAPGPGGATWYWFELVGAQVVADGEGVGLCTSCHEGGQDYFSSPFPLQ